MLQCHFCGKILTGLPFRCRHCGNSFCAEHHLPENHHCSWHHPHGNKANHVYCGNCGRELTGLPFTCHRCGVDFCKNCMLPENHNCTHTNTPGIRQGPPQAPKPKRKISPIHFFEKIKGILKLGNLAVLSILLIFFSFLPFFYPSYQIKELFQLFFDIGCICLAISYFIYAVEHWRTHNTILALLMITVPLTAAYFSLTKIPEPTNMLFFIAIILGSCVIISTISLVIGEKIYWEIRKFFLKTKSQNHWFSIPKTSYAIFGMVCISFIIINSISVSVFSDNLVFVTQSITGSLKNSQPGSTSTVTYVSQQFPTVTEYPVVSAPETTHLVISPIATPTKNLETGLISKSFNYVLRGKSGSIDVNLYSGIYNEILAQPSPVWCTRYNSDPTPCTSEETRQYNLKYLDNPIPKKYLDELVSSIKSKTSNNDDRARIAINLVQQIPYDYSRLYSTNFRGRSPYEVLYENKGVCGEKSKLLAYLLRELGYGVVLFEFSSENHMAVGIKSPVQYSYKNSGYAFIESTSPTIPTDSEGDYVGAGKLTSTPQIIQVSDGSSFSSISEEYQDSIAFNQFGTGTKLSPEKYRQWEILMWKYGLTTTNGITIRENPSSKPLCDDDGILCNSECYKKCGSHMIGKCTSNGVICEGDPNNCPSGQISCNGKCWKMCYGSSPQCTPQGLVCYY